MADELRALIAEHRACLDVLLEFTHRVDRLPDTLQLTNGSTMAGRQLTSGDFKCLRALAQALVAATTATGDPI